VRSTRPNLYGCLLELDNAPEISAETKVAARPNLIYLLREENDKLAVKFGSMTITLPSFTCDAVRFALAGPPFVVSDLPGQLDLAGKIVLVSRLVREGLLRREDGTTAPTP
jgi:hypothetical protein